MVFKRALWWFYGGFQGIYSIWFDGTALELNWFYLLLLLLIL